MVLSDLLKGKPQDSDVTAMLLHKIWNKSVCYAKWKRGQQRRQALRLSVSNVLASSDPPQPSEQEDLFERLQQRYQPWGEYRYDHYSKWLRATNRSLALLRNKQLQRPNQKIVEIACGDGNVGYVLSQYPHQVILSDVEDWCDERPRTLPFVQNDICQAPPLERESVDCVISYNSFEHFADPTAAFEHILAICRPGGLICLSFSPLYSSPFGLHAYRALRMPYAQYLFSDRFTAAKLKALGVRDLGRELEAPQPLNRWRLEAFRELWRHSRVTVLREDFQIDEDHLDLVLEFPQAFRGRGLGLKDLTTDGICVVCVKN